MQLKVMITPRVKEAFLCFAGGCHTVSLLWLGSKRNVGRQTNCASQRSTFAREQPFIATLKHFELLQPLKSSMEASSKVQLSVHLSASLDQKGSFITIPESEKDPYNNYFQTNNVEKIGHCHHRQNYHHHRNTLMLFSKQGSRFLIHFINVVIILVESHHHQQQQHIQTTLNVNKFSIW